MNHRVWLGVALLLLSAAGAQGQENRYEANWASLDRRPIPGWFNEAKFGVFIVWGPYSVPAWKDKGYAEWYGWDMYREGSPTWKFHRRVYGEGFKYEQFAPMLTAEMFDAEAWAELIARSGAKYTAFCVNYHDGFAMYPKEYSRTVNTDRWNAAVTGPKRDVTGELRAALEQRDVKFGIYYSLMEWYHPLYADKQKQPLFVEQWMYPKFKEVVSRYRPWFIFLDGEWHHDYRFWKTERLAAWLYNQSPCREYVVTNDRWGKTRGKHGDVYSSEYGGGKGWGDHPWQEDRGIGRSYGYNRNETAQDYDSAAELIGMLIKCVGNGGNYLLCVGPTADGRIPVVMQQRLLELGRWLKVNGEAIYGTRRWQRAQQESDQAVRYTVKEDDLYVLCTKWPGRHLMLEHPRPTAGTTITLLGSVAKVNWRMEENRLVIEVPQLTVDRLPCEHAWVLKVPGAAKR